MKYVYLRVVWVRGTVVRLNRNNDAATIIKEHILLQNKFNLIDTDIECAGTACEGVLSRIRRDRHLEVDTIIHSKRDALNTADVANAVETLRSSVGNLAQQLTRKVVGSIFRFSIGGIETTVDINICG